jgi:alpha-tubulin suppressor-like RCC1 family protein
MLGRSEVASLDKNGVCAIPLPKCVPSLQQFHIISVAIGCYHCSAVSSAGELYTWGGNTYDPHQIATLGHGDNQQTPQIEPKMVASLSPREHVVGVCAGNNHGAVWTSTGAVYSWGFGCQLGQGSDVKQSAIPKKVIFETHLHNGGRIHHEVGSLGKMGDSDRDILITAVAAGAESTIALSKDGQVYTWGDNFNGALGHGNREDSSVPVLVKALQANSIRMF